LLLLPPSLFFAFGAIPLALCKELAAGLQKEGFQPQSNLLNESTINRVQINESSNDFFEPWPDAGGGKNVTSEAARHPSPNFWGVGTAPTELGNGSEKF